MGSHRGTETDFELTTIDRLDKQGYIWCHGSEVEREDNDEVVLRSRLRRSLARRYPDLPAGSLDEAVAKLSCVSAWNKDPVFGVIGIQSGPRH